MKKIREIEVADDLLAMMADQKRVIGHQKRLGPAPGKGSPEKNVKIAKKAIAALPDVVKERHEIAQLTKLSKFIDNCVGLFDEIMGEVDPERRKDMIELAKHGSLLSKDLLVSLDRIYDKVQQRQASATAMNFQFNLGPCEDIRGRKAIVDAPPASEPCIPVPSSTASSSSIPSDESSTSDAAVRDRS